MGSFTYLIKMKDMYNLRSLTNSMCQHDAKCLIKNFVEKPERLKTELLYNTYKCLFLEIISKFWCVTIDMKHSCLPGN